MAVPRFLVELKGTNFLLSSDGEHAKCGFRAARIIRAETEDAARRIALIRLMQQLNQREEIVKNIPDKPDIKVEGCKKLWPLQLPGTDVRSFFFYLEDPADSADAPD